MSEERAYLLKQLQDPSSVDFCATGCLIHPGKQNLVIAKVSTLEVYELSISQSQGHSQSQPSRPSLTLLFRLKIYAEIDGMNVIRRPGRSCGSILVSYRPARVFRPFFLLFFLFSLFLFCFLVLFPFLSFRSSTMINCAMILSLRQSFLSMILFFNKVILLRPHFLLHLSRLKILVAVPFSRATAIVSLCSLSQGVNHGPTSMLFLTLLLLTIPLRKIRTHLPKHWNRSLISCRCHCLFRT
jgi:hypothetical protein